VDNVSTDTDVTMAEAVAPEDQEKGTPPNQKRNDSNVTQSSDTENDIYDTTEDQPLLSKDESDKSPARQNTENLAKATSEDEGLKQEDSIDTAETDEGLFDEARPEATFSHTVHDFPNLKESTLSPPTMVRNLPWKIMIMPRGPNQGEGRPGGQAKSMGFFLQCNGESEASSWSCQAQAELRVINQKNPQENFVRKIGHLFYAKENDWGFSHYLSWNDVCDPEKGYITEDGSVTFQVKVQADAPHGVCWDSKKHTGYVGLKNQGATCYMNSLLQVLYFTNLLRKCVYKMPTEADDSTKSVALALQRVFHDLQFLDKAVGTKKLTKSFGWETLDTFMQHDAQEFLRVLLDKLEVKMKGTCVQGIIPKLIEGKTLSYIRCKNVDYTSSRTETFYDIQLNVKGSKNLMDSFRHYVKTENLDGDNKYDAGPEHGLQDAEKGICFKTFPPILHLHLMRFQYDSTVDASVKYNDRFEFSDTLNLDEFIANDKSADSTSISSTTKLISQDEDAMEVDNEVEDKSGLHLKSIQNDDNTYVLHAVLVHSGDNHGGHYVVFVNPNCDGKWCKFDDDVVSRCTAQEAIQNNFGGSDSNDDNTNTNTLSPAARQSTNAYMLVYIRKSQIKEVLCSVKEDDIPNELTDRLQEEKKIELVKRREKNEAHLYMTLRILLEDAFCGHQGNDLYDVEKVAHSYQEVRVKKQDTLREVLQSLSSQLNVPPQKMRIWPMNHRTNQTLRPSLIDTEGDLDKAMIEVADNIMTYTVFLEIAPPDSPLSSLPSFDKDQDVMLFFKYYDPSKEKIHYMGHMYVAITSKVSAMAPELISRAHLTPGTNLLLYEEIKPNMLEKIEDLDKPLEHVLEELMDGDIIVFQKDLGTQERIQEFRLPTAREYFRDLFYRLDVTFVDKNIPNDAGFTLTLSQRTQYQQMVEAVARHLAVDPTYLQFFKTQNYRDIPGNALRCTHDGTLKEMLVFYRPRHPKKMFYQRLTLPIHELENKRQLKCSFMSIDQKEEKEVTLYPNKGSRIEQMLEEAKQHVNLDTTGIGSGQLRLIDIISHKIYCVNSPETLIDALAGTSTKSYRLEEIPLEQNALSDDEMLVDVSHFDKQLHFSFGNPFLIKIKEGELIKDVKERIRIKLKLSEKEFEKYRLAIIDDSKAHYVEDIAHMDTIELSIFQKKYSSNVQDLDDNQHQNPNQHARYFGLDHVNKDSKRIVSSRERPLKIYN